MGNWILRRIIGSFSCFLLLKRVWACTVQRYQGCRIGKLMLLESRDRSVHASDDTGGSMVLDVSKWETYLQVAADSSEGSAIFIVGSKEAMLAKQHLVLNDTGMVLMVFLSDSAISYLSRVGNKQLPQHPQG